MTESRWWHYVQAVAGDVQAKEIADRVGIDKSNVTRWKQGSRPAVEFVLKFARQYARPVVEALAEAEYITDSEAGLRQVQVGTKDLSTVDLARELLARAEQAESASANVTVGKFGRSAREEESPRTAASTPRIQRVRFRPPIEDLTLDEPRVARTRDADSGEDAE